jgi:hypothetical protein
LEPRKVNAFVVLYRSALTGSLYAKMLRLTSMAARELGQVRINSSASLFQRERLQSFPEY